MSALRVLLAVAAVGLLLMDAEGGERHHDGSHHHGPHHLPNIHHHHHYHQHHTEDPCLQDTGRPFGCGCDVFSQCTSLSCLNGECGGSVGGTCSVGDCSRLVGPQHCTCTSGFRAVMNACLLDPDQGSFTDEVAGEPDPGSLLSNRSVVSLEECQQQCLNTPWCIALGVVQATSTGQRASICLLYSRLQAVSQGADSNTVNELHAFKFHRPAGTTALGFKTDAFGRRFAFVSDKLNITEAHKECFTMDAILYPAHNIDDIRRVTTLLGITAATVPDDAGTTRSGVYVGLDRIVKPDSTTLFSTDNEEVTNITWTAREPGLREYHMYVRAQNEFRMNGVPGYFVLSSICQYVGTAIANITHQKNPTENRESLDLGAVYQIYGLQYTGGQKLPSSVNVTVSFAEDGGEMPCAIAGAMRAAPAGLNRLVTCSGAVFGRYVHISYQRAETLREAPSVYGTWLGSP